MNKSIYILLLLLISVNFWTVLPLGYFMTDDVDLVIFLFWLVVGCLKWRYEQPKLLYIRKNTKIVWWVFFAVFCSFITCFFYWNQSLLTSLIASRSMLCYLAIPALFFIKPTEYDLLKALETFSILYLFFFLANTYMPIPITYNKIHWAMSFKNKLMFNRSYVGDGDFGVLLSGYTYILFPLYYRIQKMKINFRFTSFLWATFLLIILFLCQNRSTLFIASAIYVYGILKFKHKRKPLILLLLLLFAALLIYITWGQWLALYDQTINQAEDQNYNRNKAIYYFLYNASPNWICNIFGNGFLSAHTSSYMQDLKLKGICNSDVGFIGMWNQYGVIPILIFFIYIIKAIIRKKIPFYVKAIGLHIAFCSATISYFCGLTSMWLFLFIYLYTYYDMISPKSNRKYVRSRYCKL